MTVHRYRAYWVAKRSAIRTLSAVSVFKWSRTLHRDELCVLLYHDILPSPDTTNPLFGMTVTAERFARQMEFVRGNFSPVALDDVVANLDGARPLPQRAVLVTFDDGHKNVMSNALPALERFDIPAVCFVLSDALGAPAKPMWSEELYLRILAARSGLLRGSDGSVFPLGTPAERSASCGRIFNHLRGLDPVGFPREVAALLGQLPTGPTLADEVFRSRFEHLDVADCRRLISAGVSIQSHSCDHSLLVSLGDDAVLSQLRSSKERIEQLLGTDVTAFAYPFGSPGVDFREREIHLAREAGYRVAFAGQGGYVTRSSNPHSAPRIGLDAHADLPYFEYAVSGLRESAQRIMSRVVVMSDARRDNGPLGVEELPGLQRSEKSLLVEWRQLVLSVPEASVFHTSEWVQANLDAFAPNWIRVLLFRDEETLVGVIPIVARFGRRDLRSRRWIELAGLPHADYGGVVVRPGYEPAVAEAFLDGILKARDVASAVHLGNLRSRSPFTMELVSMTKTTRGMRVISVPSYKVRRLTMREYQRSVRPRLEASDSLQRSSRRLGRTGGVEFRVATDPDEIGGYLDGFFDMHIRRFAARGDISPLSSDSMQRLYRNIVSELGSSGEVLYSALTRDGAPIAARLSLRWAKTLHLYSATFDPLLGRFSPGVLQLKGLLDYASEHGIEVVDFGIGDSPHKAFFGARVSDQLVDVQLFSRLSPYIEAWTAAAFRKHVPDHPRLHVVKAPLRRLLPPRQPGNG